MILLLIQPALRLLMPIPQHLALLTLKLLLIAQCSQILLLLIAQCSQILLLLIAQCSQIQLQFQFAQLQSQLVQHHSLFPEQ